MQVNRCQKVLGHFTVGLIHTILLSIQNLSQIFLKRLYNLL